MYEIWRGSLAAFGLQLLAGLLMYDYTDSSKFGFAAAVAVAALSGLIVWGSIIHEETRWAFTCLGLIVIGAAWSVILITDMDPGLINYLWRSSREVLIALVFASWVGPPLWLKHYGEKESAFTLSLAAAPFGIGVVLGGLILGQQALPRWRYKFERKYRRV
jgi:hypothetical protein